MSGVADRSSGVDYASLPAQSTHFFLSIPIEERWEFGIACSYEDPGILRTIVGTWSSFGGAFKQARLAYQEDSGSKWGSWLTVHDSCRMLDVLHTLDLRTSVPDVQPMLPYQFGRTGIRRPTERWRADSGAWLCGLARNL